VREARDADVAAAVQDAPLADDALRLIFTCCHPALALEAQVALTLKTLCGLSVDELARAILETRAAPLASMPPAISSLWRPRIADRGIARRSTRGCAWRNARCVRGRRLLRTAISDCRPPRTGADAGGKGLAPNRDSVRAVTASPPLGCRGS
jgi:hypothetical protein